MVDYLLNALATLFVAIDPIALAPLFVVFTAGNTWADRKATAVRSTLVAGIILIAFAIVGEPLIGVLGISIPAFRIAGGLLLFVIAFEMVLGRRDERKSAAALTAIEAAETTDSRHVAIFPLAIPLIAGPGAISATILLASQAPNGAATAGLYAIIVFIIGLCLAVFLAAERIDKALGDTGRIVVSRLLGIILAALSVQFIVDGVMAIVRAG